MLNKIQKYVTLYSQEGGKQMIQLYKNIKERRKLLGMTQTDLAKKLGYSDKSMIAKIEKGSVDIPQSKIMDFAKALGVSPGDLMGWEDEIFHDSDINELNDFLDKFGITIKAVNEEDPDWGVFYNGVYVRIDVEDLWNLYQKSDIMDESAISEELDWMISKSPKYEEKLSYSEYPYIPDAVAAGIPETIDGMSNLPKIPIADEILGKYARRKNIIIMRVNGESMNRVIQNGSIIGVYTDIDAKNLKDGDLVVFNHDYNYSLKRFYKTPELLIFRPDSTDNSFTDIIYKVDDDVRIVGKVIMSSINYK